MMKDEDKVTALFVSVVTTNSNLDWIGQLYPQQTEWYCHLQEPQHIVQDLMPSGQG